MASLRPSIRPSAKTYSHEQIGSYFITLCRANLLLRVIDREIGHACCKIVSVLFHMCEVLKWNWNKTETALKQNSFISVLFQFHFTCASRFSYTVVAGMLYTTKKQTYTNHANSILVWIFLPSVIKIDRYNFEIYHFKVCAFFSETQCII